MVDIHVTTCIYTGNNIYKEHFDVPTYAMWYNVNYFRLKVSMDERCLNEVKSVQTHSLPHQHRTSPQLHLLM